MRFFVLRVLLVLEDMCCSYSQFSRYLCLQYCSFSKFSEYLGIQYCLYSQVLVVFGPSTLLILPSIRSIHRPSILRVLPVVLFLPKNKKRNRSGSQIREVGKHRARINQEKLSNRNDSNRLVLYRLEASYDWSRK